MPILRGDRCECPSCGLCLNSTNAFDRHRVGPFRPLQRRCLSEAELVARGWAPGAAGYWRNARPVESLRFHQI
jgi:hypothetical protein